jgi:hypothetical protein
MVKTLMRQTRPSFEAATIDWVKVAMVIVATVWVVYVAADNPYGNLLAPVNFLVHEAGHKIFMFFGTFLSQAGGTIAQLVMPLLFVLDFWRRSHHFSAAIALYWLGVSLWDASLYCADAQKMEMPLWFTKMNAQEEFEELGYTTHDWINMLTTLHLMRMAPFLAFLLNMAGHVTIAFGCIWALQNAGLPLVETALYHWQTRFRQRRRPTRQKRRHEKPVGSAD